MEEDNTQSKTGGSKNWIVIAVVVIAVVLLVAGGGYYYMNSQKQKAAIETQEPLPTSAAEESGATTEPQSSSYKDGTYTAQGTYSYHAGTESINVTVTLANGVIEDVEVETLAKAPTSKVMQADFAANYKILVVGKNIDEVELVKVSGSSLTPKGFNSALDLIKTQATQS